MAVKWANVNGNWNAGATWNDGVVPTADDDVFLNGFAISLPNSQIYVVAKSISNGVCPNTGISGGYLTGGYTVGVQHNYYITADVYAMASGISFFSTGNVHHLVNINGNLTINDGVTFIPSNNNYNRYVRLNGNLIAGDESTICGNGYTTQSITVNGNATLGANTLSARNTMTINGNLTINGNNYCDSANLQSIYANYACLTVNTLTINGIVEYKSTTNITGINYTSLVINNPNTFTWKDASNPRVNPFIIVTNADMNNHQQYPSEDVVRQGVEYVWGEKVGSYLPDYPPESVVLNGYEYDNGNMTGNMAASAQVGCVTKEDVREGVPLLGMGEVGTLVVPSVDDVREGVIFDNGSVGTLIVEGGGDRLRIADFGYYTNAQSDTYIVDLTEQDKPKFAVAEERVLIEMFPDLDLENIPDKYFDDLFVKYLKYRLIVEYYRTAGINSTFTPSEPTTEIVNYRNVNCEIWMNIANTYLKAWGVKYPNSIKKQRILL